MLLCACSLFLLSVFYFMLGVMSAFGAGAWLLMLAALVSLLLAFSGAMWYGLVLFLVYAGGVLVLFMYFCLYSSSFSGLYTFSGASLPLWSFFLLLCFSLLAPQTLFVHEQGYGTASGLITNFTPAYAALILLLFVVFVMIIRICSFSGSTHA